MASNSDGGGGSNGTLTRTYSNRDYETLKQNYELDLNNMRRCCERQGTDLEYYRDQHRALMKQFEQSQDSGSWRSKYTEQLQQEHKQLQQEYKQLDQEHKQLQQDNQRLLKDMTEHNGNGSDALFMSHKQALLQLEATQDENVRLAKQCELLKQQIDNFAMRCKENAKYKETLQILRQRYDDRVSDIKRLTDERNAATQEYALTMSERDTVHKEMEKLSDDLQQAVKKLKMLDADNKQLQEEKRSFNYQLESLRREIASALNERDKAIKESNDLREKFGELGGVSADHLHCDPMKKSRGRLIDSFSSSLDASGRKEHMREHPRANQKQRLDNLDQANQELESLRKSLDKAQLALIEAVQEAEVSKGRRDWAFSERDKIVLERESIRTLCDNMRKERDRAVSELAESLRESDAIKKQRNDLIKEVKHLRETLEAQLEREQARMTAHESEFGSSIHLEVELTGPADEGLELAGGRDFPGDDSVYVASVAQGSSACGILLPHDRILRVNNVDCSQVSHRMVMETLRSRPVAVLIKRSMLTRVSKPVGEPVAKWVHTASLAPDCHGLSLRMGVYIYRISEGSLAARDKSLTVGDRILKINNKSMDEIETAREAMQVLNDVNSDVINITTLKMSYPECPNVFTPVRRYNRCSQTDDWSDHVTKYPPNEKPNGGGTWLQGTLDMMLGLRHPKEDKKKYLNSAAATPKVNDVLAHFDYVIESCNNTSGAKKASASKRSSAAAAQSSKEKNGGTWPKARVAILQSGGTVVARKKERPALTIPYQNYDRLSTPVPFNNNAPTNRHSVYKSVDNQFGMSATDSFERLRSGTNRHSVNINSDNSLEYSVVHRFEKDLPMFKKRSGGSVPVPKYDDLDLPTHIRGQSQIFTSRLQYPSFHPHHHNSYSRDSFNSEPFHTHSPSVDIRRQPADAVLEGGTFPRKRGERIGFPSNPNVTSKVSTGSIERGSSERGSPMPIFHVEVLSSPGDHSSGSSNAKDYSPWGHKPLPGELRRVHIDKSNEPLGIQINCPETGGIFVSTVNDNSLASRVGLQIGDQLLEVCGINMRNATYNLAATFLRQCGNSITMLVQYNPDKYHELEGGSASCSGSTSDGDDDDEDEEEGEGDATPCNSPKEIRKSSSLQTKVAALTVKQRQSANFTPNSCRTSIEEPRTITIKTMMTSNLGISLVGGNASGIFIHSVQPDSLAYQAALRTGDQILEYNGNDLRSFTAEEAAYELAKPADKVTVLAHYRIDKYNEIKDKPGDSLYVRCGFDRSGNDMTEPRQLAFSKDDVLYVDNTMFNGTPGQWRAWTLDAEGHRQHCGVIPSKYKVEEELLLRRGAGDAVESRTTATARRSFFRRKKHQRGSGSSGMSGQSSRDSCTELATFLNMSPGWYSDSGSLHEDLSQSSYQRVERLQFPEFRPVLVLGPLAECVVEKLVADFPDKFQRAASETRRCSQAQMDRDLADGLIVEYRRRNACYECTTVAAIGAVAQNRHCMLEGSIAIVERLQRHHIYPVVLLIKFKSTKQIKEVKDARYTRELSGKNAKEMFEYYQKLEMEYKNLVTTVVSAGANIKHICAQVTSAVVAEHSRSQWVPLATLH